MFYAHFVLAKKGPLARIWLAAHWDKKLTKAHVFEINIESSVEGILQPKVKMALRTSGHLLLGIVRIYSRKAKYLLADCNEAFIKIKMAFRPGMVDLPEGNREAAVATITLPEVFHDFDTAVPDITIDMDAQVSLNQSRAEDITIKEDYGTLSLMADDGFDNIAFDDVEVVRDASNIDDGFDQSGLMFDNQPKEKVEETLQSTSTEDMTKQNISLPNMKDNVFSTEVPDALLGENDASTIFEAGGLFDEPLPHVPIDNTMAEPSENQPPVDKPPINDDSDDDMYDMGPASMGAPSPPSSPGSPTHPDSVKPPETDIGGLPDDPRPSLASSFDDILPAPTPAPSTANDILTPPLELPPPPSAPPIDLHPLGVNEEESFALAPLDTMIVQGAERAVKTKRKRKLIVDEIKNISGEEMKAQLSDTSDIVTSLDLAPPTKRLMHWKETGGVEKLFALPGHPILSKTLSRLYQRHLTTRSVENEDFDHDSDRIVLDAEPEQARDDECSARKRRREDIDIPQDLTHVDPMMLNRPSFADEQTILHNPPSALALDMSSNYLPQHNMYPNGPEQPHPQLMSPMMTPSHMMHSMLPPDMTPLSQMMQSPDVPPHTPMSNMGHSMPPPPPTINEFNQPPSHPSMNDPHLMMNSMSPMVENQPQNYTNQGNSAFENQGQMYNEQLARSPLVDQMPHTEALNHPNVDKIGAPCNEMQNHMNGPLSEMNGNINCDVPPQFSEGELGFDKPSLTTNGLDSHEVNVRNEETIANNDQLANVPCSSTADSLFQNINTDVQNTENSIPVEKPLIHSDDDDDYGAPSSVGPICQEEQLADETYEQFEERILTKRTTHMLHIIHNQLETGREVKFTSLTRNNKRKQVAQKFYTFLVLKKQQAVELYQNGPYDDLTITKGPKFSAVYNAA